MLKTLIDKEIDRFTQLGYESIVSTEDILLNGNELSKPIGNDTYIVTGFISDDDIVTGSNPLVSVVSATDSICGKMTRLVGTTVNKVMRQYIIIRSSQQCMMALSCIKITPKIA